jgi:1-acyl-sn-glycerol-3-phosphate acyltransferase
VAAMLGRAWRLVGTGLSFAVFGVGGLVLAVVVFPVISLLTRDESLRARRARSTVCNSFRLFLWMMHSLRVFDFDVDPRCRRQLSAAGGLIVVANHPTLIDVVQLLAEVEHGNCIVKRDLWRNPFLGGVVRATNYISNDDSDELISSCIKVLRDGETLVIFPEATRTVPGKPMYLRRGAARVALAAGVPVQMVHIRCDPSTLTKAEHWYEIPPRRPCLHMNVGDRLDVSAFAMEGEEPSMAARRLTQLMHDKFTGYDGGNERDRAGDKRTDHRSAEPRRSES